MSATISCRPILEMARGKVEAIALPIAGKVLSWMALKGTATSFSPKRLLLPIVHLADEVDIVLIEERLDGFVK